MIGILTVTHGSLGQTLIETVEFITAKEITHIHSVSVTADDSPQSLIKKIEAGIKKVNTGSGVILFTDMFGGTPSNLSYSFLKEGEVEVISGLNLPVLLKAVTIRENGNDIDEITSAVVEHGKKSIALASDILKGAKRE